MKRYLAFVNRNPDPLLMFLQDSGCLHLITRRFSYGVEIDFHCGKIDVMHELETKFSLIRLDEFEEKEDSFRPEKRNEFLEREIEIVSKANDLIAQERYWESHTILENLWKSHEGARKLYYQGIILVSASMVQHQMGNRTSALSLYKRAKEKLNKSQIGGPILSQLPEQFSYPVFFKI